MLNEPLRQTALFNTNDGKSSAQDDLSPHVEERHSLILYKANGRTTDIWDVKPTRNRTTTANRNGDFRPRRLRPSGIR